MELRLPGFPLWSLESPDIPRIPVFGFPIDRCQAAPRRDHEDSNARHIMKRCPFDEILFCGTAEWFCERKPGGNGFSVGQFV